MNLEFDSDKLNELAVDARREQERLCPVCGADKQVWQEVFYDKCSLYQIADAQTYANKATEGE